MTAAPAIAVRGFRKRYGDFEAVRGIDLEVQAGEIFAILGPNGAGKTTTVEMLEGYRQRDEGEVRVLGEDPARARRSWNARIGVVLQTCQLPPQLTVREAVELYAGYYPSPRPVDESIELVGLSEQHDQRTGTLSGGQQRRLDVALALVGDPELLFLDEPTTGFDPGARRDAWAMISGLRELGKTVLLTTHYMDEAHNLADRVAIMAHGRIVAEGSPGEIGRDAASSTTITFRLPAGVAPHELPGGGPDVDGGVVGREIELRTQHVQRTLEELLGWARSRDVELNELEVRRESLEDVYLRLTAAAAG
jgi:ABC-2 type transport system ATP-binding protein